MFQNLQKKGIQKHTHLLPPPLLLPGGGGGWGIEVEEKCSKICKKKKASKTINIVLEISTKPSTRLERVAFCAYIY